MSSAIALLTSVKSELWRSLRWLWMCFSYCYERGLKNPIPGYVIINLPKCKHYIKVCDVPFKPREQIPKPVSSIEIRANFFKKNVKTKEVVKSRSMKGRDLKFRKCSSTLFGQIILHNFYAPILFRPQCFMVKRCIIGLCLYFSHGVNVEWESPVKFCVPSTHLCLFRVKYYSYPTPRAILVTEIGSARVEIYFLNISLAFSRIISKPLMKLAKNDVMWPV